MPIFYAAFIKLLKLTAPPKLLKSKIKQVNMSMSKIQSDNKAFIDSAISSGAIPASVATVAAVPYTMGKQWQMNLHTGNKTPLTGLKGLASIEAFMNSRFLLRMGPVPLATKYAKQNKPEGMSKNTAATIAAVGVGCAADALLVPTERMSCAQQTYNSKSSEAAPSLKTWHGRYGSAGAVKQLYKGTSAVMLRVFPFHCSLNATRAMTSSVVNPNNEKPTLKGAMAEIGVATAVTTVVNIALTPSSEVQTRMQRCHQPLSFTETLKDMGEKVKIGGIRSIYGAWKARVALTAITAGGSAATLTLQTTYADYVKTRDSKDDNGLIKK